MFERFNDAEIREICRLRLDNLESWLRRLAHDHFAALSNDYLRDTDSVGASLIKKSISDKALRRIQTTPNRFPRGIDAIDFGELINIICNPKNYPHFRAALQIAFPVGRDHAREVLDRLVEPRNRLAHGNTISLRHAEQILCYTGDTVASLKEYYSNMGQQSDFNVPTIMRVTDSLGNTLLRSQCREVHDGGIGIFLHDNTQLRPGDVLSVEVEVDSSFEPQEYSIQWASTKPRGMSGVETKKVIVNIENSHVGMQWTLQCKIVSDKPWHRMQDGHDDFLLMTYKVLPPA